MKCCLCADAAVVIDTAVLSDSSVVRWAHCARHALGLGDWHDFMVVSQDSASGDTGADGVRKSSPNAGLRS